MVTYDASARVYEAWIERPGDVSNIWLGAYDTGREARAVVDYETATREYFEVHSSRENAIAVLAAATVLAALDAGYEEARDAAASRLVERTLEERAV